MAKILIVDDEVDAVRILSMMLTDVGHDVLTAENGQHGINIARQARPDLIIADVLMPVMDGYAFYKELKADILTRNIPVIILSARGAMQSAFEAVGVDCFFEKPVAPQELIEKIKALLNLAELPARKKQHQRVLVSGTYREVVDQIAVYARFLGHEVKTAYAASDVIAQSVSFREDVLILEVQIENGKSAVDVVRAVRLFPYLKDTPILLYSYYHISDLGNSDFRDRVLHIEKAKDECMLAGGTEYFDRYNEAVFKEQVLKYL